MAGGAQQGAGGTQGGGQQLPSINPQSVSDMQNLIQYYQQNKGQLGGMGQSGSSLTQPRGFADGGPLTGSGVPPVQNTGGPDMTGNSYGGGFGFDQSGSDAGVGGQPVSQVQSPYQRGFAFGGATGPEQVGQMATGAVGGFGGTPVQVGQMTTAPAPFLRGGQPPQAPPYSTGMVPPAAAQPMPMPRPMPVQQAQPMPMPMPRPTPIGTKPGGISQFLPQKGLQIHGNPTAQPFMPRQPR